MKPSNAVHFFSPSRRSLLLLALPLLATSAPAAPPVIEDMGNIFYTDVVELITDADVGLQITASGNPTSFDADNLPDDLDIDKNTGYIDGEARDPGEWLVTLSATNADGTGTRQVLFRVFEREPDLPAIQGLPSGAKNLERGMDVSGDFAPFTQWVRSTDDTPTPITFFYRVSDNTAEGDDIIINGTRRAYSELGLRTYVMGPAVVTFTWGCDLEQSFGTEWDFLSFYVNEDPVPSGYTAGHHPTDYIAGFTPRTDFTRILGPGLHRLDWVLSKDFNDAAGGNDSCAIDNIRITGYPEWADNKNLAPFEAGLNLDKEQDGNNLLTEYALDLNPSQDETVTPLMTFEPDGRAVLSVEYDDNAYGVTVDIEKSTLLSPGSWSTGLEALSDSGSFLRRREFTPQTDAYYRVKVSSP